MFEQFVDNAKQEASEQKDDTIVLTVTSSKVGDDPPITIFHSVLQGPEGEWTETFGSVEQLQSYLKGLNSAFSQMGRFTLFHWEIPTHWVEPSGMRWTIPREGLPTAEHLNAAGEVITI